MVRVQQNKMQNIGKGEIYCKSLSVAITFIKIGKLFTLTSIHRKYINTFSTKWRGLGWNIAELRQ